ncbi:hypothetical protein JO972_08450 [Verrucomicrobiaceae bacterium 5K15]|uniref:Uncharacterized protein n=1 Tax=Oceaniferula flava TaxID=2800421 RepID=A0AAE2SDH5_9BACT|nr:hypothetical protein [Oceaniferula flavus]MBK1854987.1 hypothetical protein [Oceaniferula flavus]MBM1136293.1 hypothetical protein [Oceaniferula flavus]
MAKPPSREFVIQLFGQEADEVIPENFKLECVKAIKARYSANTKPSIQFTSEVVYPKEASKIALEKPEWWCPCLLQDGRWTPVAIRPDWLDLEEWKSIAPDPNRPPSTNSAEDVIHILLERLSERRGQYGVNPETLELSISSIEEALMYLSETNDPNAWEGAWNLFLAGVACAQLFTSEEIQELTKLGQQFKYHRKNTSDREFEGLKKWEQHVVTLARNNPAIKPAAIIQSLVTKGYIVDEGDDYRVKKHGTRPNHHALVTHIYRLRRDFS